MRITFCLFFLMAMAMPNFGQSTPSPTRTSEAPRSQEAPKDEAPIVTKKSITIGGKTLAYTTTTGFMPLKNATTGEVEARIFYMAYTLDNPPKNRPLMFSFNGGPGSASVWLHLGALGPRRAKMKDDGMFPQPPFEMEDNPSTWLTETDLVFIDPVGTGYSRATKPELASKFFGVNGDVESVGEFIRLYLGRSERWTSPLFLVGESYGTTRAAGLSNWLFEHGIALNGICLVSTVLNFGSIRFAENNDMPLVMIFPSYTATAWYHKRLPPQLQSKTIEQVTEESRRWASNEYIRAMLRIDQLSAQERNDLAAQYAAFTGLPTDFIIRNNFRVDLGEFQKELLRSERRTVGRLDSRFKGIDRDAAGNGPDSDPSMNAIRPPYTAVFNAYVRGELGYRSDVEYFILGGGITSPWNWGVNNGYADTSMTLKDAMAKNPYMKVWLSQGYYDMATPFFAAEYTVSAMNLDPSLRRNVSITYYEGGHMMYIDVRELKKLYNDASSFITNSLKR